ncbi:MAG: hypothetical protein R3B45_12130 [Bdellovibrionota bacterium]
MNLIITGYSKCLRPIILIPICMLILMGCKSKTSKSPNNSNKTEEQNKKTCEDNYGSFNNGVCTCKTGYTHISGDPYRCERDEVQSSNDNDYETCDDGQRRTVAECRQQRERINSITNAQDCFNNRGFWRSSSCTLSEPISESSCEEYGDSWEGGRCVARDPYTKAQRCTSFGGNWNQEQIACQCGTDQTPFDWSNNRCSGDVYGNGGQTPEQRCAIYGGQWVNQQSCICPQNSQYNQQTGNCAPYRQWLLANHTVQAITIISETAMV